MFLLLIPHSAHHQTLLTFSIRLPASASFCPLPGSPTGAFIICAWTITLVSYMTVSFLHDLPDALRLPWYLPWVPGSGILICSIHWATRMGYGHRAKEAPWCLWPKRVCRAFLTYLCPHPTILRHKSSPYLLLDCGPLFRVDLWLGESAFFSQCYAITKCQWKLKLKFLCFIFPRLCWSGCQVGTGAMYPCL